MEKRLAFEEVLEVDGYGLVIHFSDGTQARYTVDELANLRPKRELSVKLPSAVEPLEE